MARKPAPAEGDRRSQILAAALEVFSERGLEGATNTAIAARAQVTHGLIYFYFPSKEDLFCAAVEYQADLVFAQLDLASELASERASADPPEQTLRRIVSRFVAVMEEPQNVSLMRILMREAALREPQAGCARPSRDYIRVVARDLSHELSGYLDRQVERGTLRSLDTTLAAQLMTSALISVLMRRTSSNPSGTKQSREELTNAIVDLFLHGLAPPNSA
ncbi:MAG TPA: TetR family transcriptional regulator [Ktedonobacterales bacterium]|jgi:AcrR family transcriptional regulator|nr:TetR family transcriptional regulator [Ktedonobacterales bacterium]